MGWSKPVLSCIVRTALGIPLSAVLSVIGMAVASALAVFFGVSGLTNLLALSMVGAGTGAALGAGAAMFRVDTIPRWPLLLAIVAGLSLVGAGAGWAGFVIGDVITAYEEAMCLGACEYLFRPRTYIALGATIVTNLVSLAVNVVYEVRGGGWDKPRPRTWPAGSAVGSSGEAGRLSQ